MRKTVAIERRRRTDASGARTDEQLVALWLGQHRAENTRDAYSSDLEWWKGRGVPPRGGLRALRVAHVQAAIDRGELGKPATQARRLAALRSLLSWGHRVGYLEINIGTVLKSPPVPNALAERILEPDEVLRLLDAAGQAPRQGPRDHLLVRLAYVSAVRVDELVTLDWEHVHPAPGDAATLTIQGKGGKTRHVWITAATTEELERFRTAGPGTGAVFRSRFGGRLQARDAERLVEAAARRAGLPRVSPHWLRHAHATHALERGAPIQEVSGNLGHSSIATTSRYVHVRPGSGSARWLGL